VRFARPVSALLVAAGLLSGTLSDTAAAPAPRRAGEYVILAADFHVHAFPGDGALALWALRRHAERAGLHVFTLSNHNQVFTARLTQSMSAGSSGPLVIAGEEITADNYHVIAAGIQTRVDWNRSAADAIRDVHEQGGVAIAAHPSRVFWSGWDDEALSLVDGVERAHGEMHSNDKAKADFAAFYDRTRRLNPGVAAIGSSDYHALGTPGWCRTYVLAREHTVAAVLDAVRDGRTVAADAEGNLYGDPQFVQIVESAGVSAPLEMMGRWRRVSLLSAWLGVLGLVVCGSSSRKAEA
jgi:hypothetical protein